MEQGMEWGRNGGKTRDKAAIVISKSQKGLEFFDRLWGRPIKHRRYFSWVYAYNPLPHNMSKEFNFSGTKGALWVFSFEFMLMQPLQGLPQVLLVFIIGATID